jgi:hypothetical protein
MYIIIQGDCIVEMKDHKNYILYKEDESKDESKEKSNEENEEKEALEENSDI